MAYGTHVSESVSATHGSFRRAKPYYMSRGINSPVIALSCTIPPTHPHTYTQFYTPTVTPCLIFSCRQPRQLALSPVHSCRSLLCKLLGFRSTPYVTPEPICTSSRRRIQVLLPRLAALRTYLSSLEEPHCIRLSSMGGGFEAKAYRLDRRK